jgi:hypothetical protein
MASCIASLGPTDPSSRHPLSERRPGCRLPNPTALGRFGIAPVEETKVLEKRWAAHRQENGLDLHGKQAEMAKTPAGPSGH